MIGLSKFLRFIKHWTGNCIRVAKISYLRLNGIKLGENCMISLGAKIDLRRGQISIGNNVSITHGCVILSHDAAARKIDPNDDGCGSITINDNVFIGVNTVILRNVEIGENTIIGAGSVVSKSLPANVVAAGSPAKIIREINPQ